MEQPDPIQLAEGLHRYQEMYEIACAVTRTDPAKRDKYVAANNAGPYAKEGLHLGHFGSSEEVGKLLEMYDRELAREPKSYDDYLSRMFYANSASFLYHLHHVVPAVEGAPEQEREFLLHLGKLTERFCATYNSMTGLLTHAQAVILVQDTRRLLEKRFVLCGANVGRVWVVTQCKCAVSSVSYDIVFEDDASTTVPLEEAQLLEFMQNSQLVN